MSPKSTLFSSRMLVAATAAATIGGIVTAMAQAPAPDFTAEKCYGVAKAGSNDCASTGNNSCAGTSRVDADPNAWIFVPTGVCAKIVDGSTMPGM